MNIYTDGVMIMYETILYEAGGGVATITLNRPEKLNSINRQMVEDLRDAISRVKNDPAVRCLVLTGAGRGFCAGADLSSAMGEGLADVLKVLRERYNPVIKAIRELDRPVVAAVNGVAAGAGCSTALACDLVIAARSAVFVQSFVNIGLVPDAGGSYFLPRLAGQRKAMEMALLGEGISAEEAERLGMINRAVPDDQFRQTWEELAARLSSGPFSQALIKTMFNRSPELGLDDCLEMEADFQGVAAASEDVLEGIRSFLEKRKPQFKGK